MFPERVVAWMLDGIYPRRCPVCEKIVLPRGEKICPQCIKKLKFVHEPTCRCCGKEIVSAQQEYCADCVRHPKSFDLAFSLINYEENARRSMAAIKYKNKREYLDIYSEWLCAKYQSKIERLCPNALIPVPIHRKRYQERGFNQAEELAKRVGTQMGIPVWNDVLLRKKNTIPLKELNAAQRLRMLKDTFYVSKSLAGVSSVILTDDIYTTGATAEACTRALKQAGVKTVYVMTICIGSGRS